METRRCFAIAGALAAFAYPFLGCACPDGQYEVALRSTRACLPNSGAVVIAVPPNVTPTRHRDVRKEYQ
jgi:hypothetical protein